MSDSTPLLHNLKSPLVAIKQLTTLLLENNESYAKGTRRKLRLIRESAAEASERVQEADGASLRASGGERVNVAALTEDVLTRFRPQAVCKDQTLEADLSARPPILENADPQQIREAIANLVGNALTYSPHGATVKVTLRRRGDTVNLAVTDNGPGLTKAEQDSLFEPFQSCGPDPTGNESSSSIGLYVTQSIAERHDGRVTVDSRKGEGSTFTLVLPTADGEQPAGRSPQPPASRTDPLSTMVSHAPIKE